jgi:hypothetical protein
LQPTDRLQGAVESCAVSGHPDAWSGGADVMGQIDPALGDRVGVGVGIGIGIGIGQMGGEGSYWM